MGLVSTEIKADDSGLKLPPQLSMPAKLVLVRHGESEANIVSRAKRKGLIDAFPEAFLMTRDREFRLSEDGVRQAEATGSWLSLKYPLGFDAIYASDHTRARETAALACLAAGWSDVEIRVDPLLGERSWGSFASAADEVQRELLELRKKDPLHNRMPDGDTILETRERSREMLDRCARQYGGKMVLAFSHGEYIESLWSEVAHMDTDRQIEFFNSAEGDIKNCQVVEFSSVDPESGEYIGKLNWVKSSCPHASIEGNWLRIEKQLFTPKELLERVNKHPRLNLAEWLKQVS